MIGWVIDWVKVC